MNIDELNRLYNGLIRAQRWNEAKTVNYAIKRIKTLEEDNLVLATGKADLEVSNINSDEYINDLEELLKMEVPNVKLILKMLTESPWPTGDLRWQFVEGWCKQFIRLHSAKEGVK